MSDRLGVGFFEAVFEFRLNGDPESMLTSLGMAFGGDPDPTTLQAVLDLFALSWKDLATNQYTLGPGWVNIGTTDPEDFRFNGTGTTAGTINADASPQNCAYLIKKLTTSPGRRHQGRMYVPGVPEGSVNANGMLLPDILTDAQTRIQTYMDAVSGLDAFIGFYLFHNKVLVDPGPPPVYGPPPSWTPDQITNLTLEPQIGTQRRRMRR